MKEKVTCFLPCRKGSERIPRKNIKKFSDYSFGLVEIKLAQLVKSENICEIILSTNDDEIIDFANSLDERKIKIHKRIDSLCSSATSTDELVQHVVELIPDGHVIWTHVTSPFLSSKMYDSIISSYFEALESGYDSLMTTTLIHGFLWNEKGPINYDRGAEKWPRTQTIAPIHEINSGAFMAHTNTYKSLNDRIGSNPLLYPLDKISCMDIDWPEDFMIAECAAEKGLVSF